MDPSFYTKNQFTDKPYSIGDYTYGSPRIFDWDGKTKLTIGKYCSIADDVSILLGGNHNTHWVTTYPFSALHSEWPQAAHITGHPATKGDIVIGNDVWLGFGVTVLSGVTIGDGAVIAARSVVTKDIPPYCIAGGAPAKVIKHRFPEHVVEKLLKLQWWNWSENKIRKHIEILCSDQIHKLV
jgi:acetyltransferase-like isoleucine patch superfamily enzyme